ncbi:VOC family protein [Advenella incenata]|jgi:predicted lactoylglutathione lyase
MISYTMVGTNDLEQSICFYDPLFAQMGLEQCFRDDNCVSWGKKSDITFPRFFTGYPFDGKKANAGNGVMTAFVLEDSATIDRLYAIAMREGGSDEGEPGFRPRYGSGFYAAYVQDPDNNKIAFVAYLESEQD